MTQKTARITGGADHLSAYLAELMLTEGYSVHGIKRRSWSFNTGRLDRMQRRHAEDFFIAIGDKHSVPEFVQYAAVEMTMNVAFIGDGTNENRLMLKVENTGSELQNKCKTGEAETLPGAPAKAQHGWMLTTSVGERVFWPSWTSDRSAAAALTSDCSLPLHARLETSRRRLRRKNAVACISAQTATSSKGMTKDNFHPKTGESVGIKAQRQRPGRT